MGLIAVLGCVWNGAGLAAAEPRTEEKSKVLRTLKPTSIFARDDDDRRVLPGEEDLGRKRDDFDRTIHTIYFPPNPPPLGVEMSLEGVDDRLGAPASFAPYAMEPFYAPLSTRLIERSLTRRQQDALDDYMARKAEVLAALRARLAELANVGPELRLLALEEFAERQAPALAALESEADDFRVQFYTQPSSSSAGSWYEWRGWKLGRGRLELPRAQTLFFEGQLMRGAAFYQAGLSPAQRLLLREGAIELEALVFPDQRAEAAPSINDWFWFFSPALARVRLPDDLPEDVQDAIAEFQAEKSALKSELRDVVYEQDRAVFASSRAAPLAELAAAQAPRIASLEQRAEAIRRRLAVAARQTPPIPPPPLPGEIAAMIEAYEREKHVLERELGEALRRAIRHLVVPGTYEREKSALAWNAARLEAIDRARVRWREDNDARVLALREKLDAIRGAVEAWVGPQAKGGPRGVTGSFLKDFFARRSEQQGRYECHVAVFEPGLSPEQRRLLFQAGIVALNLPLPGPEEQPTSLPGTLLK